MECVFDLHGGQLIHSITVNEGFCVTGAADGLMRVWPLDFSDYFLEAQHKGTYLALAPLSCLSPPANRG